MQTMRRRTREQWAVRYERKPSGAPRRRFIEPPSANAMEYGDDVIVEDTKKKVGLKYRRT